MSAQTLAFTAALLLFFSALCASYHVPFWVNLIGLAAIIFGGPILFKDMKPKK